MHRDINKIWGTGVGEGQAQVSDSLLLDSGE